MIAALVAAISLSSLLVFILTVVLIGFGGAFGDMLAPGGRGGGGLW